MAKVYVGDADACPRLCVTVMDPNSHERYRLRLRLDLVRHSPAGFGWGYGHGASPAQLALAILADATGTDNIATRLHQDYKSEVIAKLPMDAGWTIKATDVLAWVQKQLDADREQETAALEVRRQRRVAR